MNKDQELLAEQYELVLTQEATFLDFPSYNSKIDEKDFNRLINRNFQGDKEKLFKQFEAFKQGVIDKSNNKVSNPYKEGTFGYYLYNLATLNYKR
jgi:hypothetical protein